MTHVTTARYSQDPHVSYQLLSPPSAFLACIYLSDLSEGQSLMSVSRFTNLGDVLHVSELVKT